MKEQFVVGVVGKPTNTTASQKRGETSTTQNAFRMVVSLMVNKREITWEKVRKMEDLFGKFIKQIYADLLTT